LGKANSVWPPAILYMVMQTIIKLVSFSLPRALPLLAVIFVLLAPSPDAVSAKARVRAKTLSTARKPASQATNQPAVSTAVQTNATSDEDLLKSLTLKQKIGQMFMIGFSGTDLSGGLDKAIDAVRPGAIVVFSRNIKNARQISNLNLNAQKRAMKASHLPLLIAVDQEGGDVVRIRPAMPLPSALSIGETGDPQIAERAGEATGKLLKTLGFNMNLAPVLDVSDPSERSFIGTRTFGNEPKLVAKLGVQFAMGLQTSEILSTAKHFPGHGGIREDSHRSTPERDTTKSELEHEDLVPFAGMKKQMDDHWAVMLAHISYPSLDPSGLPATFSKPIVTGLLRKKMGFQGLVITDDIEMAGASRIADVGERAVQAIEAGVDMVMIAWNRKLQTELAEAVMKAVQSGRIKEARIDESVRRMISVKRQYAPLILHIPSNDELSQAIRNPAFVAIAQEVMDSKMKKIDLSIHADYDESIAGKNIFVFSASDRFYRSFRAALDGRKTRLFRLGQDQEFNIDRVMRANPGIIGLLYLSGQRVGQIASHVSEDVARRLIVINVETEGVLKNADSFRLMADVYFRHPDLGAFAAVHLFNKVHSAVPTQDGEQKLDAAPDSDLRAPANKAPKHNPEAVTPPSDAAESSVNDQESGH
jgi:beta-N-acetylhexosaminidase